jgi:hypothetical protein
MQLAMGIGYLDTSSATLLSVPGAGSRAPGVKTQQLMQGGLL